MRILSADEAIRLVRDGDTIVIGGSHAVPEELIVALERRFLAEGSPRALTALHCETPGDGASQGATRLAHPGLLKRVISGAYVDSPAISTLVLNDHIEGYTLPQGALSQLMREMAGGRPGLTTHVGLHTFVDPRHGGGRQSPSAKEDLVELVTVDGAEWLRYKPVHIDIALLRGTTADEDGNISMEHEPNYGEGLSMAQATRRMGGIVIVQVARLAQRSGLPAKSVKIPGILVDIVTVAPAQRQTYIAPYYNAAYAGEIRIPMSALEPMPLTVRKVIARRAALELEAGAICNLGVGISTGIATVAAEEGILDEIVLTNEQGLIGGAPAGGVDAGASTNYMAVIDQPYQFDFYDGGGLDLAFLSFGEASGDGNVNVSRFAGRIVGIGGFMNISQNARKVIFSAPFTTGGLSVEFPDGRVRIVSEGRHRKFVDVVEQVTHNGRLARERGQEVIFVTERAVFRGADPLELIEVAPGIDLERDVIAQMGFRPAISPTLHEMDPRVFQPPQMGLAADVLGRRVRPRSERLAVVER